MNPSMDVLIGATQGLALTMSIGFLTYVGFIVVPYVRHRPSPPATPAGSPGTCSSRAGTRRR